MELSGNWTLVGRKEEGMALGSWLHGMSMSWDEECREDRTHQFKMALKHQSGKARAWGSMAWLVLRVQTRNHQCVDMIRLAREEE